MNSYSTHQLRFLVVHRDDSEREVARTTLSSFDIQCEEEINGSRAVDRVLNDSFDGMLIETEAHIMNATVVSALLQTAGSKIHVSSIDAPLDSDKIRETVESMIPKCVEARENARRKKAEFKRKEKLKQVGTYRLVEDDDDGEEYRLQAEPQQEDVQLEELQSTLDELSELTGQSGPKPTIGKAAVPDCPI